MVEFETLAEPELSCLYERNIFFSDLRAKRRGSMRRMKSEWRRYIELLVVFLSWGAVSSGFGFAVRRRHFPARLPVRIVRVPKYYFLFVKAIPQRMQEFRDYSVEGDRGRTNLVFYGDGGAVAVEPGSLVAGGAEAFAEDEATIDRYTITHEITRVRRRGHIYSKYLHQPRAARLKRGPTRKYPSHTCYCCSKECR